MRRISPDALNDTWVALYFEQYAVTARAIGKLNGQPVALSRMPITVALDTACWRAN